MRCRTPLSGRPEGTHDRHGGYVLVVTLALLVLAASLMVAVGRAAMQRATAARLAADELQHRWGATSCRAALLPYAEVILAQAGGERRPPAPFYRTRVQLGGEIFELTVADEQGKANVNALYEQSQENAGVTETRLRQALSGTGLGNVIRLRPTDTPLIEQVEAPATAPSTRPADAPPPGLPEWVSGFGQVFENMPPQKLLMMHGNVRLADVLTCWGNGALNLNTVSPTALRIGGGSLTVIEITRLLEAREALYNPGAIKAAPSTQPDERDPVRRLLRMAGIDPRTANALPVFTVRSNCHSLWIVARDRRRDWFYFNVMDVTDKDHPRTAAFVW